MKFFSYIIFAIFFICAVQAQRGGNRKQVQARKCPDACPLLYQQTCGFNGRCYKEFSSSCALGIANCNGNEDFKQVEVMECLKRGARICPN